MNPVERALAFQCKDDWLYGILSLPEQDAGKGLLIVVGGPQYRVGSHRQFTLLARYLAARGISVLRFDCRGMGDSEGERRTFEDFEGDLSCAIDKFFEEVPTLKALTIWGLCDAASAALFYAYSDPRVAGLVLVNPWVRTEQGVAKVYLKHYYLKRLFDLEFWHKLRGGNLSFVTSIQSLFSIAGDALAGGNQMKVASNRMPGDAAPLPERMFYGLSRFEGNILLILSGNDFTAQEFLDLVKGSRKWQKLLTSPRVQRYDLLEANHTFSQQRWRDQVAAWTVTWIESW